jgi:RNA binding exosome subunit
MAKQRPVQHLEITTFVHSTEDSTKVVKAVSNLFPEDIDVPPYEEVKLTGVFGDQLLMLKWVLKNRRPATEVVNKAIKGMSSLDQLELIESLDSRIDENKNFYLRLDKQKAFTEVIKIEKQDPIRLKARMLVPHKADPVKLMYDHIQELTQDA